MIWLSTDPESLMKEFNAKVEKIKEEYSSQISTASAEGNIEKTQFLNLEMEQEIQALTKSFNVQLNILSEESSGLIDGEEFNDHSGLIYDDDNVDDIENDVEVDLDDEFEDDDW